MNRIKVINIILFILGLILFLATIYLYNEYNYNNNINNYNDEYFIYIPAVLNNSNHLSGTVTEFILKKQPGNGLLYVSIPPLFLDGYESAIYVSKQIACYFLNYNYCNNFDFLINIHSNLLIEGYSNTAGLTLLFLEAFYNKIPKYIYPVTGYMLPNGLIAPISGLNYKLNATLNSGFKYLIAPSNRTHILPAYTIFQLLEYYYGYNLSFNTNSYNKYMIQYNNDTKTLADQICNLISNKTIYENYYHKKEYYVAASICFDYLSSNNTSNINVSKQRLEILINDMINYLNKYKCNNNFQCEQIKQQVFIRLLNANESLNNTKYAYYRYLSAIGWLYLLNTSNHIPLENSCNFIDEQYNLLSLEYNEILPNNMTCTQRQTLLSNLYYYIVSSDPNYLNNYSYSQILNLINYYYNKYGLSITSYNYLQFSEYLYKKKNYKEALYFLIQALEYAT